MARDGANDMDTRASQTPPGCCTKPDSLHTRSSHELSLGRKCDKMSSNRFRGPALSSFVGHVTWPRPSTLIKQRGLPLSRNLWSEQNTSRCSAWNPRIGHCWPVTLSLLLSKVSAVLLPCGSDEISRYRMVMAPHLRPNFFHLRAPLHPIIFGHNILAPRFPLDNHPPSTPNLPHLETGEPHQA